MFFITSNFSEELLRALRCMEVSANPEEFVKKCKEDPHFNKFIEHFKVCPVCNTHNHLNYLEDFYFSNEIEKIKIKKQLFSILDNLEYFSKNIMIGIPCCSCFQEIFQEILKDNTFRNQIMEELREIYRLRRIFQGE